MRILIYEHMSAAYDSRDAVPSLLAEGRAMLEGIAADLASAGADVAVALHPEQPPLPSPATTSAVVPGVERRLAELASQADRTILIAPENGKLLTRLAEVVVDAGNTLWGPDPGFIRLASDKIATAMALGELSIPTWPIDLPGLGDEACLAERVVIKPIDGAGCQWTIAVAASERASAVARLRSKGCSDELIVQPDWPGVPASLAVVGSDTREPVLLPAVLQQIDRQPIGDATPGRATAMELSYRGGSFPIDPREDLRARQLVRKALDRLPAFSGYVGFDLVLGEADDGSSDRIIEINPRLTTSYVGYRAVLPGAMGQLLFDPHQWIDRFEAELRRGRTWRFLPDGPIAPSHEDANSADPAPAGRRTRPESITQ